MADSIDIEATRLADWLLQRHKLPSDYAKHLKALDLKTQQLSSSLSNFPGVAHLMNESLDYWQTNDIMTHLANTPQAQHKTIFGAYQDSHIHQWHRLTKLYQKNGLHVASLARTIKQTIEFELPALRQDQKLLENQINHLTQKNIDGASSCKVHLSTLETQLSRLAIEYTLPFDIKQALSIDLGQAVDRLQYQLPTMYEQIVECLQNGIIQKSIDYYYQYIQYLGVQTDKLEMLEYIRENGNDTVDNYYKIRRGDALAQQDLEQRQNRYDKYKVQEQEQEIEQVHEIEWAVEQEQQQQEIIPSDQVYEIDWDIQMEDQGQYHPPDQHHSITTLLQDKTTRNALIDNITEMLAFIKMRHEDQKSHSSNSILQVYDLDYQKQIYELPKDLLVSIMAALQEVLSRLQEYRITTLLQINEDAQARDRLINRLAVHQDILQTLQNQSSTNSTKQQQLASQLKETIHKQEKIKNGLVLRQNMAQSLLQTMLSRPVCLVGKINSQ